MHVHKMFTFPAVFLITRCITLFRSHYKCKIFPNRITKTGKIYTCILTVSVLLEPRGSIFHYGFLGGVLFKFEQPGGVFKVGLYWAICMASSIWSSQNQTNKIRVSTQTPLCQTALCNSIIIFERC